MAEFAQYGQFLGEHSHSNIPGGDLSEYLCRGMLRIFWGRFLGTITAYIYVVKY